MLESAALAQPRSAPPLASDARLDDAVELAIGHGYATPAHQPFSCDALRRIRAQVKLRTGIRCSFPDVRASIDRLEKSGRVTQEQISRGDGSVLFAWKRAAP
jgi:hypothetical protein